MAIGIGVFLLVVGAVLAFAVNTDVSGVDLQLIGWIVMGAGVVAILIGLIVQLPRSRRTRSTAVTTDQAGRQYVTEQENRIDGI